MPALDRDSPDPCVAILFTTRTPGGPDSFPGGSSMLKRFLTAPEPPQKNRKPNTAKSLPSRPPGRSNLFDASAPGGLDPFPKTKTGFSS